MSLVALSLLLDKIHDVDKDHRYMATSDLARELQSSHLVLHERDSTRVVNAVLKQLNDPSGDISGLANTCLGTLAGKLDGVHVEEMCNMLLRQMRSDKNEIKRDVAYLGLKTVIQNLKMHEMRDADRVASSLGQWLMECMQSDGEEVASNGYDLLLLYLNTHGSMFPNTTQLAEFCVKEFENPRPGIRKKAMQCLGKMASSLSADTFGQVCTTMVRNIKGCLDGNRIVDFQRAHTLVMAMAFVGRGAGYRLESHVVELTCVCLEMACISLQHEDGIDLVEACLVMLELGVINCPKEVSEHMSSITDIAICGVSYDPNYAADSDMEDGSEDGSMQDGDDDDVSDYDDEEDDAFSDDDDSSWKVRRAACKVLMVELKTYTSEIEALFDVCYQIIMKRIVSEREEIVRQDVFAVYMEMLGVIKEDTNSAVYGLLQKELGSAVCKLTRTMKKQSQKIKSCMYTTLESIVGLEPGLFNLALSKCSSDVIVCLSDEVFTPLQVNVLKFLEVGFDSPVNVTSLKDFVSVADEVFKCTQRKHFALAAVAINVCQKMVYLIRPNVQEPVVAELTCLVLPFFMTISDCLSRSDKPQEVKNAAIDCIGDAVARMGDLLDGTQVEALAKDFAAMPSNVKRAKIQGSNQYNTGHLPRLEDVVSLLVERLNNEMTRLGALRALKKIIESPLHLQLGDALGDAITSIRPYLRKLDRQTRITSVETLSAIMTYKAGSWNSVEIFSIVDDVSSLISDDDLGVSNSVILLLENCMTIMPDIAPTLLRKTSSCIQELISSPTLQSSSLEHVKSLLETIAAKIPDSNQKIVIEQFVEFGYRSESKHTHVATAKCVAALAACSEESSTYLSSQLCSLSTCGVSQKVFLLYCIREVGAAKLPLQNEDGLRDAIMACLDDEASSEAAASALGGLAAGLNPSHLNHIRKVLSDPSDKKSQYHMLRALVEALRIISRSDDMIDGQVQEAIEKLVDILIQMNLDDQNNEELHSIIAQCYGLASFICPDAVLPTFEEQLGAQDARQNIMALSGMRSAIGESESAIDDALRTNLIPQAMKKLSDDNVSVRRCATLLLGLASHNKLFLVQDVLPSCITPLIVQTRPDPNLIRVVNLGPFKHKIDDGLEQRKSAFDCLGILISKCWHSLPEQINILGAVIGGLADQYEVKLKCHDLIITLAQLSPTMMLSVLDQVVEPFTKTLTARVKSDAVRQEVDRNEDMLRSCLRAVDALDRIDGSHGIIGFKTFLQNIVQSDSIAPKFRAIIKERNQTELL